MDNENKNPEMDQELEDNIITEEFDTESSGNDTVEGEFVEGVIEEDFENNDDYQAPVKKTSFFKELSKQAVCKIFFLFAGVGIFFPFFTMACEGEDTRLAFSGLELAMGQSLPIGQGMELPIPTQMIVVAAFACILIGLILTVCFKGTLRNIFGAVFSFIPLALLTTYYFLVPQTIIELIHAFATEMGITDMEQLKQFNVDPSLITAIIAPGLYFVAALMLINFIYFIVMIAKGKKEEAIEEDMDTSITFDFGDVEDPFADVEGDDFSSEDVEENDETEE